MHRSSMSPASAMAAALAASLAVLLLAASPSLVPLAAAQPQPPPPPATPTPTPSASAPFSLPTGSLAQLDRAGRAPHCVRVPQAAVPFCQDVVADRWIALPPALMASGTQAQAAMLSMDTFARTAVANWTKVLDGLDCRKDNPERRYSVFRTCDDCAHAYRYWLCASLFAECVPGDQLIPIVVNRSEPAGSFRLTAMAYLASPAAANATLTAPERLDKPLESQLAVLNVTVPLKLAQPVDAAAVDAAKATLRGVFKEDTAVDEYKASLPCISICHQVIQSCPSVFQFACPRNLYSVRKTDLVPGQDNNPLPEYMDYDSCSLNIS